MDSRLTLIRTFAVTGAIGAAVLPFYQQFLHGGRGAADIAPRTAEYLSAHMVGAFCSILLVFGLIAIHLKHGERTGLVGLIAVMTVICGQIAWAARWWTARGRSDWTDAAGEAVRSVADGYAPALRWVLVWWTIRGRTRTASPQLRARL